MASFQTEPTWSDQGRGSGRVLIEAAEWHTRESLSSILSDHGFDTSTCPGPEGADGRCPLAAGDGCRAADEADVVVHALQAADVRNIEVLRSHRRCNPATPVIVEVPEPTVDRSPETYEGTIAVAPPLNRSLIDTVADAIEHRSCSLTGVE